MADRLESTGLGYLFGRIIDLIGSFIIPTGQITSLPKVINNSKIDDSYVVDNPFLYEDFDLGWVTVPGKLILYGTLASGQTLPSVNLRVRKIKGLSADPVQITLREQTSGSENGNYLVAEAKNLIPSVQYSWWLMKYVDGTNDVQVYSIGATTNHPTYTMWFQEVPRSLEDGESYYVQIKSTSGSEARTTSNTVEFEGAS